MYENLEHSIRAVAIVAELNKAIQEGSFKHLQEMMSDLGFRIELRKPKKTKKQILMENGYEQYDQ